MGEVYLSEVRQSLKKNPLSEWICRQTSGVLGSSFCLQKTGWIFYMKIQLFSESIILLRFPISSFIFSMSHFYNISCTEHRLKDMEKISGRLFNMRQLQSYLHSSNGEILHQRLSEAHLPVEMSSTSYTSVHLKIFTRSYFHWVFTSKLPF